jgi:prevent-host-death family protein
MEQVSALKLRNHLGEILDRLRDKGEPILVSKGRKIRAVLVTPEQFETRFLDWQAEEQRQRFLNDVARLKKKKTSPLDSLTVLRQLRGYER